MSTYASVSYAKWDGKYHIVFAPKGRTKARYGKMRKCLGLVLHALASQRRSQILEGHMVQDHVHMLMRIPPQHSVSSRLAPDLASIPWSSHSWSNKVKAAANPAISSSESSRVSKLTLS